ncbi:MAG: hypothetical protein PHD48_08390 [Alphaproteobacteria bacterium]|nr:hypothetical protein [Alphaproteobacteria bacterium]
MTKQNQPKRRVFGETSRDHMETAAKDLKVTCTQDVAFHSDRPVTTTVERVNDKELTSLYALLAYVAHNQNVRQDTVQMILEAQFGVDHVAKIRRHDYMHAIEFLVDMKMDEIMN